jgi:hypothetical protein
MCGGYGGQAAGNYGGGPPTSVYTIGTSMTGALGSNYAYGLTSYLSQIPGYQISTSGDLTWSVMYYTPNPSYDEQAPGSMIGKYSLLLFDMGLVSPANNCQAPFVCNPPHVITRQPPPKQPSRAYSDYASCVVSGWGDSKLMSFVTADLLAAKASTPLARTGTRMISGGRFSPTVQATADLAFWVFAGATVVYRVESRSRSGRHAPLRFMVDESRAIKSQ